MGLGLSVCDGVRNQQSNKMKGFLLTPTVVIATTISIGSGWLLGRIGTWVGNWVACAIGSCRLHVLGAE